MTQQPSLVAVGPSTGRPPVSRARLEQANARMEQVPITQGSLALHHPVSVAAGTARPVLRAVPDARPVARGSRRPGLPDASAWATRLAQAVAEVLAGDRPISQLVRWTDTEVFAELNRRVRVLGLTTTACHRGAKERSAVRSIHVSKPTEEVAEIAAHVRYGARSRAMALRLEVHRGRWVCTALELG